MIAAALLLALAQAFAAETTVGMPARISSRVLPGSELIVARTDANAPLVLRIVATYPHGDAHRYDFEFWALESGEYDLREHLERADGSPLGADELPPIPVKVGAVLANPRAEPHAPLSRAARDIGGYRTLLIAAGLAWVVGLAWMLWSWRERRAHGAGAAARPRTLAERLRPLVERARKGQLSSEERAQLELSLIAFWRRKLRMEGERPEVALARLREHAQAGPLLVSLEQWLHEPSPREEVDVAALLEPYRDLPADSLEPAAAGGR